MDRKKEDQGRMSMYYFYVLLALNHDNIVIGCYLIVAGVFALLLSLVILSVISWVLLRRDAKDRGRTCSTTMSRGSPDDTYTYLEAVIAEGQNHKESIATCKDNAYARPFMPGDGISLSRHCLTNSQDHDCSVHTQQRTSEDMVTSYCDLDDLLQECMHMFNPPKSDSFVDVEEK